jgi:uncharacterized protein
MIQKSSWIAGSHITAHSFSADLQSAPNTPILVITANLHGDECTGIGVVHRIMENIISILHHGTLVLYPSLNPDGLRSTMRHYPEGKADLNRCFPGRKQGFPAEQHLYHIWNDIIQRNPTALIDLHTDSGAAVPYTLVDRVLNHEKTLEQKTWEFAKSSQLLPIWEYPINLYRTYKLDKSLAGAALNQLRIPAITVEVGPRRRLDPKAVDIAYHAILGWMKFLGMYKNPKYIPSDSKAHFENIPSDMISGERPLRRINGPIVGLDGIFSPILDVGSALEVGSVIGYIYDVHGSKRESVLSPYKGYLIALTDHAFIKTGNSCCTIAVLETDNCT